MAKGTIDDPRMNSREKEYGILVAEKVGEGGRCKNFVYLKNGQASYFTFGTPVIFEIEERNVDNGNPVAIELATDIKLDEDEIKFHPVIRNLNRFAKLLLHMPKEKLEELANDKSDSAVIAELKKAVENLVGPFDEKDNGG